MVIKISAFLILIFNCAHAADVALSLAVPHPPQGMVTLATLYMTLVYSLGHRQLPDGLDSIALPFAGLFALPSVRSVMPGDPPFGACFVLECRSVILISPKVAC